MRLLRHVEDMPKLIRERGSVISIGSFDGVHLGHQHLLERVRKLSRQNDLPSVVMSFEPSPEECFSSGNPPARLMRFREKFTALADLGIDVFYCPRFDATLRNIRAVDFIRQYLVHALNARHVVVGDDFKYARNREGSIDMLRRAGGALEFGVHQAESFVRDGIRVSSTAIRKALLDGELTQATHWLGKPYQITGKVIKGRQVGRTLGYPTANIDLKRRVSPVAGIYAVRVTGLREGVLNGVASVGTRPTFDLSKPLLEVHLFDFDREIYGDTLHVDFIAHLRDEVKFDSVEELVAQMDRDAENARSSLADN